MKYIAMRATPMKWEKTKKWPAARLAWGSCAKSWMLMKKLFHSSHLNACVCLKNVHHRALVSHLLWGHECNQLNSIKIKWNRKCETRKKVCWRQFHVLYAQRVLVTADKSHKQFVRISYMHYWLLNRNAVTFVLLRAVIFFLAHFVFILYTKLSWCRVFFFLPIFYGLRITL